MRGARQELCGLVALLAAACADSPRRDADSLTGASGHGGSSESAGIVGSPPGTAGMAGRDAGKGKPIAVATTRDGGATERDATVARPDDGRDAGSTARGGDGASGPGVDAGGPNAAYSTRYTSGGYNHLVIDKLEHERGYCVQLAIAWPNVMPADELDLPPNWTLEYALGIETSDGCSESLPDGGARHALAGLSARGRVAWHDPGPHENLPCSIDVDVEITFAGDPPIPASEHLLATDLPVDCDM